MAPRHRPAPLRSSAGRTRAACSALLAGLLAACAGAPPAPGPMAQAQAEWPGRFYDAPPVAGRVLRIDPAASQLTVLVFRSGRLAAQGHDHAIALSVAGAVFLPDAGMEQARVDLRLPLDALEVDPPALRRTLGDAFAAAVPERARAGTRRNLLGPALLDAGQYPYLDIAATVATGAPPRLVLDVDVVARGQRRRLQQPLPVQVQVDAAAGVLRARGSLALRHADLGLTPFSALGGLLRVADPLLIEFELLAREVASSQSLRPVPREDGAPALYSLAPSDDHARLDSARQSGEAMEQR